MRSHILIVDPSSKVRRAAKELLEQDGHFVFEGDSLNAGLSAAGEDELDLVFLSWRGGAPTNDRLTQIRQHDSTRRCQIIITAAEGDMHEAIATLDLGADDCMRVPFFETEFRARVNACLRRKHRNMNRARLVAGPIVLDKTVHRLFVEDHTIDLAPTEFRLMAFFLENQNRVFSRRELLHGAWTKNSTAGPRTVDVHVRRLRQVLEPFGYDDMIQTVRSFGYRFSSRGDTASPPNGTEIGAARAKETRANDSAVSPARHGN
jgi:two-component system phosphate regulon response regulator PhoB